MTKLLTTKQVRVDTDYMHFCDFLIGGGMYVVQQVSIGLPTYQNHLSDMINPSLYGKLSGLYYTAQISPSPVPYHIE